MVLSKNEKELILALSRQAVQEISGWKMFIFLPQTTFWRFLIIVTISVKCVYNFTRTIYMKDPFLFLYIDRGCEVIYGFDLIFSTLHFLMRQTRKLRHGKRKNVLFLVIDYISMIPLETIYHNTLFNEYKKDERVCNAMNLVAVLRIYQIPRNFSDIKDSIYKMRTYVFVTIFQVLLYSVLLSHFLGCFIYLYFNAEQKVKCLNNFFLCVAENTMETYFLLSQSYVTPISNYTLPDYSVLVLTDFFLGYFYTYGYVIPLYLFVSIKLLLKFFEYSKQLSHLRVMTGNLIEDKKLRKMVSDYFRELWAFGRFDKQPKLMNVFPLGLKKNIFCDMHWEAMRHSYLLEDLSFGCKRSLALCMRMEFLLPNVKVFEKNKHSTSFLYLESGLLQVMAEENSHTPVLNLSAGTVLGELSFYLPTQSLATVRAGKFSVIHTLATRDFIQVLMDYPNDKKKVFRKVTARIKFAKSINEIKTNVFSNFMPDATKKNSKVSEAKRGNIKWIKRQYRAIYELKQAEELLHAREHNLDEYERKIAKLETEMKHTSVNLLYISISEGKMKKPGTVCLTNFPWLMDPQCQFIQLWRKFMCIITMVTLILHPAFIPYFPYIPLWFFSLSCVISLVYIVDILLKITTAVRIKNFAIENFSSVFVYRVTSISFLIDLLAAIPFQIFVYVFRESERYGSNLYFMNALLKVYILIPVIYKLNYRPTPLVFIRTAAKYLFFLIILIYIASGILYVTGVECIIYDCGDSDWYKLLKKRLKAGYGIDCAVLKAVYLGYRIPEEFIEAGVIQSYAIYCAMYLLFQIFYYTMNGECTAAYVLELTYDIEQRRRINLIYEFMGNHKMVGPFRNRVMSTMQFQWIYDKNNYITGKADLWEALPQNLKTRIQRSCILPVISKSKLFELEDEEFLLALCRKSNLLVLPANYLLLTLGIQTTRLYIVQEGFVQINSFIDGDLYLNTSRPITAKKGDTFPVIDVFSQTPSSVTAVTITDCKLLMLELEDVLSEMIIHGIFKDFVEAVKETDLSKLTTAKLGVSQFKDTFGEDSVPGGYIFKQLMGLGTVLKLILKKKAINSHSNFYLYWELARVVFIMIYCIAWPIVFGLCYGSPHVPFLFELLSFSELPLSVTDFYIRLNVAYYNSKGIFVSNTLYTARHYLTTAFLVDLISFSPNFHIWYLIFHDDYLFEWPVFASHVFLRSLSLYRVVGYLSYLKVQGKVNYSTQFITVGIFVFFLVHYYVCFAVYVLNLGIVEAKFTLIYEGKARISPEISPYEFYLQEMGVIFALATRGLRFIEEIDVYTIIITFEMATMGMVAHFWMFSHLILIYTTSSKNLTTYQYYMQSFVNFLSRQKADEAIVNQAVGHFEYEWQQRKGGDLEEILASLPQSLNEDITYSLYRTTLEGIICLSGANEFFYRTISRLLQEIYLKENSVIIFRKEVQSDIFIIHSGVCSIKNSSQILYKGAMIGDIKLKGIMTNTIIAITPVKLLKISSQMFFTTLGNFYTTKLAYQAEVARADDFLVSRFIDEHNKFPLTPLEKHKVECEFVPFTNGGEEKKKENLKKKRRCYMKYDSKVAKFFRFIFMLTAYITVLIIPIFMTIRLISPVFLSVIYVLDLIWLVKIIMILRMVTQDSLPVKMKKKLRFALSLKIIFDILAVFPLELIPLVHCGIELPGTCCFTMCMCYVNRMLRMFYIFKYFKKKGKKLLLNFFMNVFGILMLKVAAFNVFCSLTILLKFKESFEHNRCYKSLNAIQIQHLLKSYICVISDFMGAGILICKPESTVQVLFHLLIGLWALLMKAFFITHVLMLIYVTHNNKSNQMVQLEQLDNYLSVRDVSSRIRADAQKYFCNFLNSFYEGGDMLFLSSAPTPLRTAIMENIYMPYLRNCLLFRGLDEMFLKQLTTRLHLSIFFPGDYICEKGDVDHNMYFIQSGEVYCIEKDANFQALERVTNLYTAGTTFGIQQGILPTYPHIQTYRAKTLANVLVLNYDRWEDLRRAFPEAFQTIYKSCKINTN